MTYLITGYIFVGVCYATAFWRSFGSDLENRRLLADLKKAETPVKVVSVFLMLLCLAAVTIAWLFLLLTRLFSLLMRK